MKLADDDRLISRIVDREAEPSEWTAFVKSADRDPRLWRKLGLAMHDEAMLSHAVAPVLERADRCEAPLESPGPRLFWRTAGWAAASLVVAALVLVLSRSEDGAEGADGVPVAESPATPTSAAPYDAVLGQTLEVGKSAGRVVCELPQVLVGQSPVEGGVEVLFVRRVLERRVVTRLVSFERDDEGRVLPVPVSAAELQPVSTF